MMTFEQAFDLLNDGNYTAVAEEMISWHPVILGQMLTAVAIAKRRRYPLRHPSFDEGVSSVLRAVGQTPAERVAELKKEGGRE